MRFLTILICLVSSTGALADAPKPEPMPVASIQAFGAKNPSCAEWSDGCVICKRQPDASSRCSTPGIACQGRETRCQGNP